MKKQNFIAIMAPLAEFDQLQSGVPASLTIAQAALESAWGTSELAVKANNLFGIKGQGTAGSMRLQTTEYVRGVAGRVIADFRAYNSWAESVADHSSLLVNGVSWDRDKYAGALRTDGRSAAAAIGAAGYATDPEYADKLIRIIDQYNLDQYDAWKEGAHMTPEEKAAFSELQNTVAKQAEWIKQQQALLSMPCPDWAKEAYRYYKPYIADETGSYDFWRQLVIQYRKEKGIKVVSDLD